MSRRMIASIAAAVFLFSLSTASTVYAQADESMEFVAQTYAPVDRSRTAETMVSITLTVKISSVKCDKPYTISLKWNAVPYRNPALMGQSSLSELALLPSSSGVNISDSGVNISEFVREFERKAMHQVIVLGRSGELHLSFTPPSNAEFSNDDARLLIVRTQAIFVEGSFRIPFCVKK